MRIKDIKLFLSGTLRGRLILGVALVHAVMMTLFITDLTVRQRTILLNRQIEEATALAQSLSTSSAVWIESNDISGLQELVETQKRYPELTFAIITDEYGHILAHTDQNKNGLYLLDLPKKICNTVMIKTHTLVDVMVPARLNNRHIGWIRVSLSSKTSGAKLTEITFLGVIYAILAIIIGSVIAWFMGRLFIRKLQTLQNTISEVKTGNLTARSKITGTDEVASIATEFNSLLDTLDEQRLSLSSSETKYKTLIENINIGIFQSTLDGKFFLANSVIVDIAGYTNVEEFLKIPATNLYAENADRENIIKELQEKGFVKNREMRSKKKNGDIYWIAMNAIFLKDSKGKPISILGSIEDITERKIAELKLHTSEQAFRDIVENSPDVIVRYDRECRRIFVNPEYERVNHISAQEILGTKPIERSTELAPMATEFTEKLMASMASGNVAKIDLSWNKNKKPICWFVRIIPEFDAKGKVISALTIWNDISERKQAEEALQESEEKYRTLIHKIQVAVIVHGADTKILTCNPEAQKLLGLTEDQLLGKTTIDPAWHFYRENNTIMPLEEYPVNQVMNSREVLRNYIVGTHRPNNDNDVWALVNADPVFDEKNEIIQVIVTFIDITERKEAEATLAKTAMLLNEAQKISHIGSWELDIEKNALTWSNEIYRMFEIDPIKFGATYEAFLNAIHPEDRKAVDFAYTNSLKTKLPYTINHRLLFPEGRMKYVHEECETIYDEKNNPVRSIGIVQDITERKLAEEALRESEWRYREIFDNVLDGLYLLDVTDDGRFRTIEVNSALERTTGIPRSFSIGKTQEETVPAEVAEIVNAKYRHCIEAGHPIEEEAVLDLPAGRRYFLSTLIPTRNETGHIYRIIGISRDITERKKAEEERLFHLRFMESLDKVTRNIQGTNDLNLMMNNVLETVLSIFDCDRTWLFYPCDPDAEFFKVPMEITKPEYPGAGVLNVNIPMPKDMAQNLREALESNDPVTYTLGTNKTINKISAEQFGVKSMMIVALFPKSGKPWAFGLHQCSTPRIWSEEEIKLFKEISTRISDGLSSLLFLHDQLESEERYRELINLAVDGILLGSHEGIITEANECMCTIVGMKREEFIGKHISHLPFMKESLDNIPLRFDLLQKGKTVVSERILIRPDTSLVVIEMHTKMMPDGTYQSIFRDITERKQAEKEILKLNQELEKRVAERTSQLEAANKELETFSYSVAHDLRAPLRSIDGFSQVLIEDYHNNIDNQGKNYLQRIRSATQRMAQLIDDILKLSHVSRGEINIQPVNLSKIAQSIASELRETQPERQVEFIIQNEINVYGDSRLLQIVLDNLIGNAWKFTSKHTTAHIEFGMQQEKETIVYFIRDDGAGFDMNYIQKLFGVFQRLHSNAEFSGTGVGLATVQRIIHKHGGKVWAEAKIEQGATIYFTIP